MDRVPTERLEAFRDEKYHWPTLTPSDVRKVVSELLILRERVDCHIDSQYDLIQTMRDELDVFNVVTHRPKGE